MGEGYMHVPAGKLAAVVTYLEMRAPQPDPASPILSGFTIRRVTEPDLDWYRELYRRVGEPWLWFSRLRMSEEKLKAVLHDKAVDVFALSYGGEDHGLLEFDRRQMPDIELTFFGVTTEMLGKGAGRALLAHTLPIEWAHQPKRIWVHTCTSDHHLALAFYRKAGFVPYKRAIEIADDPRLTGDVPRDAAPHIPLL
jgi:GNAT superfamily N-acetyltransferase